MEILERVAEYAKWISAIIALAVIFIKPLREWFFGISAIRDGQICILRSEMLRIYYAHKDSKTLRQYEDENFIYLYSAYKAMKGNSFIDKIKKEVDTWTVET